MTLPDGPFESWGAAGTLPFLGGLPVDHERSTEDDWWTPTEGGRWRELCRVEIDGTPKAQPRARSFALKRCSAGHFFQAKAAVCPRCGKPGAITTRQHDPGTAEGWKGAVAEAFLPHRPVEPLGGLVRIDFEVFLPRPKSLSRETRAAYGKGHRVPKGPVWCRSKPDRDNLDKALLDALVTLRFLSDDAIVVAGEVRKFYHAVGAWPGARVRVMVWEVGAVRSVVDVPLGLNPDDARESGRLARRQCIPATDCRLPLGSVSATRWLEGWAEEERRLYEEAIGRAERDPIAAGRRTP